MKGNNQHGNGNCVTFTFLHFVQFMYDASVFEINSIIQDFPSTMGSNEVIVMRSNISLIVMFYTGIECVVILLNQISLLFSQRFVLYGSISRLREIKNQTNNSSNVVEKTWKRLSEAEGPVVPQISYTTER